MRIHISLPTSDPGSGIGLCVNADAFFQDHIREAGTVFPGVDHNGFDPGIDAAPQAEALAFGLQEVEGLIRERYSYIDITLLRDELAAKGPVQPEWKNYGVLSDGSCHCHLGLHHSACRRCEKKSILIEVSYVGSRESAPY